MEVICTECSATLSLPDHSAGKKAKCPRCETVFVVPESSGQPHGTSQIEEGYFKPERHDCVACPGCERWLAYTPDMVGQVVICPSCGKRSRMPAALSGRHDRSQSQSSAVSSADIWPTSVPASPEINPYAHPNSPSTAAPVRFSRPGPNYDAPGWILMITAVIAALYYFGTGLVTLLMALSRNAKADDILSFILQIVALGTLCILQSVVFLGGLRMTQRRNLMLARTAAIMAIIPCSGCCLLQLPVGIWATILLFDAEAQRNFES